MSEEQPDIINPPPVSETKKKKKKKKEPAAPVDTDSGDKKPNKEINSKDLEFLEGFSKVSKKGSHVMK